MGFKTVFEKRPMAVEDFVFISIEASEFSESLIFGGFGFGGGVGAMQILVHGVPEEIPFRKNVTQDAMRPVGTILAFDWGEIP